MGNEIIEGYAPKVLIMSGYGINCESESAHAFELAGAETEVVHINDLIDGLRNLSDYDIIMFPGGFSYGDDTGSGNAFANKLKNNLWDDILEFVGAGKLMLGVCNGFQVMTHLGLFALPSTEYGKRIHSMEANSHNRYECRWVHIANKSQKCVFTRGIDRLHIPIAHGEGRFYCEGVTLSELQDNDQIVFEYCSREGMPAEGFPDNPNGSLSRVAAICDRSGRLMGMMPHPERSIYAYSAPDYQLKKEIARRNSQRMSAYLGSNLNIFVNAVGYVRGMKDYADSLAESSDESPDESPEPHLSKTKIREKMFEARKSIPKETAKEKSIQIMRRLQSLDEFNMSKTVMAYISLKTEVNTGDLIKDELAKGGRDILVPVMRDDKIMPVVITDMDDLVAGKFGILEPRLAERYRGPIDCVIVPGVAFDKKGHRVGFGKGCYDSFLQNKDAIKIGLAFDEQLLEIVPSEEHDIPVDIIVTETRVIRCGEDSPRGV